MNSTEYSLIEQPVRAREKHYQLFQYILKTRYYKEDKKHVQVKLGILWTVRELSMGAFDWEIWIQIL